MHTLFFTVQQQLQEKHNDIKETVEESIKIKSNQGTKYNLKPIIYYSPRKHVF